MTDIGTTPSTPCREWHGARHPHGYGQRMVRSTSTASGRTTQYLHRWVWEQGCGPIPPGMVVRHLCDNPPCFRFDHLQLGTHLDNMRDMAVKGRRDPRRGEQNHSAKLTEEDVYAIRQLCDSGRLTHRQIAAQFNVARSVVTRIARRRTWTHLREKHADA